MEKKPYHVGFIITKIWLISRQVVLIPTNISFQSAQLFLSRALRFEDFTLDMVRKAEEMFDFMNLKLQPVSQDFIYKATHPNTTQDLPHNVHIRDPATVVSKWWKKLSMPEVKKIQSNCKEAMELWGYMPIKNYNDKHELFDTNFKLL